ncbi:MAG TPA: hypothetical protein VNM69_03515 [Bacillus sp. (in: firmicutes)]|uniref:hypothetical protein n=1 Tax=Bacillus litorisediminis TaxID=2922713 RepID=UPI001FAFF0A6|nr:hypothetical protein [Bacillus litorisediminis]HWO74971.1 hypothetical protein [Bacillus sp. (in: firmicutes)]
MSIKNNRAGKNTAILFAVSVIVSSLFFQGLKFLSLPVFILILAAIISVLIGIKLYLTYSIRKFIAARGRKIEK